MVALDFTDLGPQGVEEAVRAKAALILPAANVAAHGPHLPLSTSIVVSSLVAARAVGRLRARGVEAYRLPPLSYAPAETARNFPGTIPISREASARLLEEILSGLVGQGFRRVGICCISADPGLWAVLALATRNVASRLNVKVAVADPFDSRYAERLPPEFVARKSHGGRLETAIFLATHPEAVVERTLPSLPPVEVPPLTGEAPLLSLGAREGYAGDPARASAEDGDRYLGVLGECVAAAILELPPS